MNVFDPLFNWLNKRGILSYDQSLKDYVVVLIIATLVTSPVWLLFVIAAYYG